MGSHLAGRSTGPSRQGAAGGLGASGRIRRVPVGVLGVVFLLAGLPGVLAAEPAGSPPPSVVPGARAVGPAPAIVVAVGISVNHHSLDLGLLLNATGKIQSPKALNYSWSWSHVPRGCPSDPANLTFTCVPNETGTFTLFLSLVGDRGYSGSGNTSVTVATAPAVVVTATPPGGRAPLTVVFYANVSGGAPPVAISWISSDGSIASGPTFNHTFLTAGSFTVDLWVNDSTSTFYANGSYATVLTVHVTPAPPVKGLFGLPDHDGELLIGAAIGVLLALALYEFLSRRRPSRLPPAEAWMRPPERPGPPAPPRPPSS